MQSTMQIILYGAAVGGYAACLFAAERLFPLRRSTRRLWGRLLVNLTFAAVAFVVVSSLVKPAAQWTLRWSSAAEFGLVRLISLPLWGQAMLAFVLMDLTFYWWHRANHRVPLFWRFHNVHHLDPDLDVSTAFRFHFGELAFSAGFRILQVGLIGISAWTYVIYSCAHLLAGGQRLFPLDLLFRLADHRQIGRKQGENLLDQLRTAQIVAAQRPVLGEVDQVGMAQNGQILGDVGLGGGEDVLHVGHTLGPGLQFGNDLQPGGMGEGKAPEVKDTDRSRALE